MTAKLTPQASFKIVDNAKASRTVQLFDLKEIKEQSDEEKLKIAEELYKRTWEVIFIREGLPLEWLSRKSSR